jgi:hypothetical protein
MPFGSFGKFESSEAAAVRGAVTAVRADLVEESQQRGVGFAIGLHSMDTVVYANPGGKHATEILVDPNFPPAVDAVHSLRIALHNNGVSVKDVQLDTHPEVDPSGSLRFSGQVSTRGFEILNRVVEVDLVPPAALTPVQN